MKAARRHLPVRLLLCGLSFGLVVSCAGGSADQAGGGGQGEPVTLNVQQSLNTEEGQAKFAALAKEFESEHPKIHVQISNVPWDKLTQVTLGKIAADNGPDIIMGNSSQGTGTLFDKGLFLDLTDYLNDHPDLKSDFPDGALDEFGAPIGLPFTIAQEGIIFYRPKMFAAAGVKAPAVDEAWTWAQFMDAAKKLTVDKDGDGKIDQYAFGERGKAGIAAMKAYIPYGLSFGTDIITKKDGSWTSALGPGEPMRAALQTELSLNKVRPQSYLAWQTPEAVRAWNQHQVAMINIGAWFAGMPDFKGKFGTDYDVMLFPTNDPANRSVYTAYNYWHVMKSSKHQQQALAFLSFLYEPKNLQALAQANKDTVPATISGQKFDHYNEANYPLWADRLSKWQKFSKFTPSYPEYQALWLTDVSPVMESIAQEQQSPTEGFDKMDAAIKSDLSSQD